MAEEKIAHLRPVKNKISALQPYHFDEIGGMVHGAYRKRRIEPYVSFNLSELAGVPVAATAVWVLLLRQWRVTGEPWVTIPKRIWMLAGLKRHHVYRGYKSLEHTDLVSLRKHHGNSTQVRRK